MNSLGPGPTRAWLPAEAPSRDLSIADATVNQAGAERAISRIRSWPGYSPTPLRPLAGLAREAGVRSVLYKDEAVRFGAGNFKVLGAAYAVDVVLAGSGATDPGSQPVLCCASDGNHGRALAWTARRFGVRAVVYLPEHALPERRRRIRALGAEVIEVDGPYDDAVGMARREATRCGWILVSDTVETDAALEGGSVETERTRTVMQGYAVVVDEVLDRLLPTGGGDSSLPTHVFLQAGVGTFAAAITARLAHRLGDRAPRIALVEPAASSAVHRLLSDRGRCPDERDDPGEPTSMDCLVAGHVSALARPILRSWASAAITISDGVCASTLERLPASISAGPSGVAGLAGFVSLLSEPALRAELGVDGESTVLAVGTEESVARGRTRSGRHPEVARRSR